MRSCGNARRSREQTLEAEAVRAFAAALEETAGNGAEASRRGDPARRLDLDRSQPVESLGAKMEGIRKAVEVACAVMRTDAEH